MKRRDYELIARAMRAREPDDNYPGCESFTQWRGDCVGIANALAAEKPGFDRALFLNNCGVPTS